MDEGGYAIAVPVNDDADVETRPLMDFKAGYVLRALDKMPKQGPSAPWHLAMSYREDEKHLRKAEVDDGVLRFVRKGAALPTSYPASPVATAAETDAPAPTDAGTEAVAA
jgi:hypothetical protein